MSETVNQVSQVATQSPDAFRWLGEIVVLLIGVFAKIEFNRIWNVMNQNSKDVSELKIYEASQKSDKSITIRVDHLEESIDELKSMHEQNRLERKDRDKELFNVLKEMNEKLHAHIETAATKADMSATQALRKVLREDKQK